MNINENLKNTLMVDIETTGTAPGCKVLTIGAFGYTPAGEPVEFYERLDIKELDKDGFEDDMSTISWWKKQSDAARSEAFGGKAYPKTAFKKFSDFVSENFNLYTFYNPFQVWSCGIDFDFPILKEAAEFYGQPLPWKFWQQYDYRTLKRLFGLEAFENNTAAHTALDVISKCYERAGFLPASTAAPCTQTSGNDQVTRQQSASPAEAPRGASPDSGSGNAPDVHATSSSVAIVDDGQLNAGKSGDAAKRPYGEYRHVMLTNDEGRYLREVYGSYLETAIGILDSYIENGGKAAKKYKNHAAALRKGNWVWQKIQDMKLSERRLENVSRNENNTAAHIALEDCKAQMRGLQAFRNLIIDKDAKIARLEAEIDTSRTAMKAMAKENS